MDKKPIVLYLLSGFFGAGKTTLLKRLSSILQSKSKIGLIINEFGNTNIDKLIMDENKSGIKITELNGGSVFCACIKKDFLDALLECSKYNLDILLLECSGMADASSIEQVITDIKKRRPERDYSYGGALCVVSAVHFEEQADLFPVIEKQIKSANIVLLNKIDLCNAEKISKAVSLIKEINPNVTIKKTSFCRIDEEILDSLISDKSDKNLKSSYNTPENRPVSVTLECKDKIFDTAKLREFLLKLPLIRAKGFVMTEEGLVLLNLVEKIITITKVLEDNVSSSEKKLVLIAPGGTDLKSEVAKAKAILK